MVSPRLKWPQKSTKIAKRRASGVKVNEELLTQRVNDEAARRLIRWYGRRWGIQCWHQVLKDVCKVETRQMKSAEALSRVLTLDMIVAWRVLLLCRLGKTHPHLPASLLYSPEELAVLEVLLKKAPLSPP